METTIHTPITRRTMLRACCVVTAIGLSSMLPLGMDDSVAVADDSILGDSPVIWRRGGNGGWHSNVGTSVSDAEATFGVDVSEHDGRLDWHALRESGVSFAIIRCGFGGDRESYDDARFMENVHGCEKEGIPYGIYLYSYALSIGGALDESAHALRLARRCTPSLGIWHDIEEPRQGAAIGWHPSAFAGIINTFIDGVRDGYGKDVPLGVYASKSYLAKYLTDASLSDVPIWMAQWAGRPTGMPDTGMMWQAGSCSVSGARYPLDFDVHFSGSLSVGRSDEAFTATREIAALERKLSDARSRLERSKGQLAAATRRGYKERNSGTDIMSLLDARSMSDAIRMMSVEEHVADSVIDAKGRIDDAQSEIATLQAMIGGKGGR